MCQIQITKGVDPTVQIGKSSWRREELHSMLSIFKYTYSLTDDQ